jgi:hypothetical protein
MDQLQRLAALVINFNSKTALETLENVARKVDPPNLAASKHLDDMAIRNPMGESLHPLEVLVSHQTIFPSLVNRRV